jgi:ABC-2 type transport system permease protein
LALLLRRRIADSGIRPFLTLGAVQVAVILIAARAIFAVLFERAPAPLLAGVFLFVLAPGLPGYLISTVSQTQMQALPLSIFVLLPSILLSGFMFPFRGMPGWTQIIGEVLPVTHFLRRVRAVMLKGAGLADVRAQFLGLGIMVVMLALVALMRFKKTLDRGFWPKA